MREYLRGVQLTAEDCAWCISQLLTDLWPGIFVFILFVILLGT